MVCRRALEMAQSTKKRSSARLKTHTHTHLPPKRYELLLPKRTSLRHRVPCADEGFLDFLACLLAPDPGQRPGAEEALCHPWLRHAYPPIEPIQD